MTVSADQVVEVWALFTDFEAILFFNLRLLEIAYAIKHSLKELSYIFTIFYLFIMKTLQN